MIVALFIGGPFAGRRREVQEREHGAPPLVLEIPSGGPVLIRYVLIGASTRAREWRYRHEPSPDEDQDLGVTDEMDARDGSL
ncbi:hypothetical protein M6D93_11990 [Jatrophihabitans telluris]|uniref:Uncharacterized protein n=1 Tax=Jatrophihabitans telluris TaxID=2038343 RepID=A0ABY4QV94_9ACTN|nr:hypothetical protein [Jatrophihabitans telluris]UQX87027.1 hypothetical protein M6D93_11990 [Jatrophihabitans telluris]